MMWQAYTKFDVAGVLAYTKFDVAGVLAYTKFKLAEQKEERERKAHQQAGGGRGPDSEEQRRDLQDLLPPKTPPEPLSDEELPHKE